MREISFRVWDKDTQQGMFYGGFSIHSTGKIQSDMFNAESLILMQYTGLEDKNGVDIYEGDILEYPNEEMKISIYYDLSSASYQFNEHGTYDDGVGRGKWNFTIGIANCSEVIGNIYQNPGLLS